MKTSNGTIDLTKLATDRDDLVKSMTQELEGPRVEESTSDMRWPARFISSGEKGAPRAWGTRFLAAGPKKAPSRH